MQLQRRAQINVSLPGPGLHFDGKVEDTNVLVAARCADRFLDPLKRLVFRDAMPALNGMKIGEYLIFREVQPVIDGTEDLPEVGGAEIRGDARLPAKEVGNGLYGAKLIRLVGVELERL